MSVNAAWKNILLIWNARFFGKIFGKNIYYELTTRFITTRFITMEWRPERMQSRILVYKVGTRMKETGGKYSTPKVNNNNNKEIK